MRFENGNNYAAGKKTGRPRKEIKLFQAECGIKKIIPFLRESDVIPQALKNIAEAVTGNKYGLRTKIECSQWVLNKFLPDLVDIDVESETKIDFGVQINAMLGNIVKRLPKGNETLDSHGGDAVQGEIVSPAD